MTEQDAELARKVALMVAGSDRSRLRGQDPEDVAQEAVLKMLTAEARGTVILSPGQLAAVIVVRYVASVVRTDRYRDGTRTIALGARELDVGSGSWSRPDLAAQESERAERVRGVMNRIPDRERERLLDLYWSGGRLGGAAAKKRAQRARESYLAAHIDGGVT